MLKKIIILIMIIILISRVVRSLCSFTSDGTETPSPSEEPKFRLNCDKLLLLLEPLLLGPEWPGLYIREEH